MRKLSLTEYSTRPSVPLTPDQCQSLREVAPSVQIAPAAEPGCFDLTPSSYIGTVSVRNLSIEIRPKVLELDRVLFLLSYSLEPRAWRDTGFSYGERSSVLEAVIPGFVKQLRRAFRRGVLQGYREMEDALMAVRGRLRFDDQIRDRFAVFPPAEVRYDEFTEDIELNRFLKAALVRLEKLRLRASTSRANLRAFTGSLERVDCVEYHPARLPDFRFSRLNEHYRTAITLARLILSNSSFELEHGKVRASSFLVDMNRVFEDFVLSALRERLGLSDAVFPKGCVGKRLRLDRAGRVRLKPDLSWWEGGRCLFVGDVKYKRISVPGVPNADLYQLLAYTVATGLPRGLLIYATGEGGPGAHEIARAGKTLHLHKLDLGGEPSEILDQVAPVADFIREMKSGHTSFQAAAQLTA